MKKNLIALALLMPMAGFAQEAAATNQSAPLDAVLILLLFTALVLLGVIIFLGKTITQLSGTDYQKLKNLAEKATGGAAALITTLLMFAPSVSQAAEATASQDIWLNRINWSYFAIGSTIAVELLIIAGLISALKNIIGLIRNEPMEEEAVAGPDFIDQLVAKLSGLKPMEKESELIMEDHKYDGIYELDNSMPPWLKFLFIGTVIFAGVYLFYYHVYTDGTVMLTEYTAEMNVAKEQQEKMLANAKNLVDETNVIQLTDASSVASGKAIYYQSCVPCHGKLGEGGVGPNFTDEYWIHGGGIADLFKTVKYGVSEKGMISWKDQLKPLEMQQVSSYILTLKGTNPPNAKAPQGVLYNPTAMPSDSLKSDSATVAVLDTIKK